MPAPNRMSPLELLPEIGEKRLAAMDATGITVQVLSTTGPGADLLDGKDGVDMAREINDHLAEAIARHPDRFAGFTHLAMREPEAAAKELERGVRKLGFRGAMTSRDSRECFRWRSRNNRGCPAVRADSPSTRIAGCNRSSPGRAPEPQLRQVKQRRSRYTTSPVSVWLTLKYYSRPAPAKARRRNNL